MLAYDQAAMLQPLHQLPDASFGMTHAANALAALNLSAHSMDAQALMMQSGLLSPSQGDFAQALLSQLPSPPGLLPPGLNPESSSPQHQLLHAGSASSPLQHFDMGHDQHGGRVFVPDSLKSGAGNLPASSSPTQAQFLQQAALGQQQQLDQASLVQSILQNPLLLQQALQQQAAVDALTAAASMPPGLGQQPFSPLGNSMAGNTWGQGMQPANLAEAAAAAAAAAAMMVTQQHQQQQQQQVQDAVFKALAMLSGTASSPAQGGFPAHAPLQVESWAANALARQQQAAGYSPGLVNPHQLASILNTNTAGAASIPRAGSLGAHGRRRSSRRSSGTTATAVADFAAYSGSVSRANSTAGSEAGADGKGGLPAVLPAGITPKDLCPSKYEDTWAEAATVSPAASVSSDDGCQLVRGSSSASTSSTESIVSAGAASVTGSALSLSSSTSRAGSAPDAEDRWQWDSHFCSLDEDTASRGSSGVSGRACRKAAAAAAKQQGTSLAADADTRPSKDQSPASAPKAAAGKAAAAAGVWIPGQREAAGDDSWYLPRPPTCRLFVGNIGCWVDESMLLGYFGKYGNVVDVQVMWNTKMLARGRRVNREFAFISYSSPLEAARAVHWLDGCRLPDMEKDKNGVTVEYENGEGDGPAAK